MLKLENIWFRYPGSNNYLFKGLNAEFSDGELTLVVGPNGSGKSTLLMIAGGLIEPERGHVFFRGELLKRQLPRVRRFLGILFQDPEYMLFNPTVYDEIAHVPRQIFNNSEDVDKCVRYAVNMLKIPEDLLRRTTYQLSYGEKKLVALASIISYKPSILLLDEPFDGLSRRYRELVLNLIKELLSNGRSVVVALHEPVIFKDFNNVKTVELGVD